MENAKYFDVHDTDITPEIYTLLFCGAFVEVTGNDTTYLINPFEWENYPTSDWRKSAEESFASRLERGYQNCYFNSNSISSSLRR